MGPRISNLYLRDQNDTARLAAFLAAALQADDWLLCEGAMGTGKTTLTRYVVAALGGDAQSVVSPTYTLMQHYPTQPALWHIDAWRMHGDEDFAALGVEDLAAGGIVVIEWPSRIPILADRAAWRLDLLDCGGGQRQVRLSVPSTAHSPPWQQLDELCKDAPCD